MGAGVAGRRSAVQATTTTLGRSTGIHLECRTHHNVSETEIGLPDQGPSLIGIYAAAAQVYR